MGFGKSRAYGLLNSEDVNSAIKAVKQLGIKVYKKKNYCEIIGKGINGFTYKKKLTLESFILFLIKSCLFSSLLNIRISPTSFPNK